MTASSPSYDLVIVGFGMATHRLLQELGRLSSRQTRILVLGEEAQPAYNRVLLPQLLENAATDIALPALQTGKNAVTVLTGETVVAIDRDTQQIHTASAQCFRYRQLVLATGSAPLLPDFCQTLSAKHALNQGRIMALRTATDVTRISAMAPGSHIVVQGGGFIALETAAALSAHYRVSICHRGPYLMNRQLDETAATLLQTALEARGIKVLLQTQLNGVQSAGQQLQLAVSEPAGLRTMAADLLIAALGVQPQDQLARSAGLDCQRGIVVNTQLQSSDPNIFAIGECAECQGETVGLVAPVYQQAAVLAARLTGDSSAHYQSHQIATNLKISGLSISSVGDIPGLLQSTAPELKTLVYQDQAQGDYRRIWLLNGQIQGAVLCGDTSNIHHYQQLLQAPITAERTADQTAPSYDWLNSWLFQVA